MPIFNISDPETGRSISVEMDSEPTQEEAAEIFASIPKPASTGELRRREGQDGIGEFKTQSQRLSEGMARREKELAESGAPSIFDESESTKEATRGFARYGLPLFAPGVGAGTGIGSILGGMAVRGSAGALGESIAQLSEGEIKPSQIAGAGLRFAGPAIPGRVGLSMAAQGPLNVAARAVEGGEITPSTTAVDVGVPAGIGTAIGGVRSVSAAMRDWLKAGIERAKKVEQMATGVRPTAGQVFPELSAIEQRAAAKTGGEFLRQQLSDQQKAILSEINRIRGGDPIGIKGVVESITKAIGTEEAQSFINQAENISDLRAAIESVRSGTEKQLQKKALNDALDQFANRATDALFPAGVPAPFREVQAGALFEDFADNLRKSLKDKAEQLYAPAKTVMDFPAFSLKYRVADPRNPSATTSVEAHANELIDFIPDNFRGRLRGIQQIIDAGGDVSLNQLKEARNQLYDFADVGAEAIGTVGQRKVRELISTISNSISQQAPSVLGTVEAAAIKAGDEFYAATRPKLDLFGVRRLFAPETQRTGQGAAQAGQAVLRQGLDAPEIKNLIDAYSELKSRGAAVPSIAPIQDRIQAALIEGAIDPVTGSFAKGSLPKLAETISNVERQTPGSLSRLGFGSPKEIKQFTRFLEESKDVSGPEAVSQLLSRGRIGFRVVSAALDQMPDVKSLEGLVQSIQRQASSGNKLAADALIKLRAQEIEDVLVKAKSGERVLSLEEALNTFANPAKRAKVETILGKPLVDLIDKQLLPGMQIMREAEKAAGRAGSTVGGAATEELISGFTGAIGKGLAGQFGRAAMRLMDSLLNERKYALMSQILSKGAGVSGLQSKKRFWERLNAIGSRPKSQQEAAISEMLGDTFEEPSPE